MEQSDLFQQLIDKITFPEKVITTVINDLKTYLGRRPTIKDFDNPDVNNWIEEKAGELGVNLGGLSGEIFARLLPTREKLVLELASICQDESGSTILALLINLLSSLRNTQTTSITQLIELLNQQRFKFPMQYADQLKTLTREQPVFAPLIDFLLDNPQAGELLTQIVEALESAVEAFSDENELVAIFNEALS